jgi:SAM-dependent methyltransferase
MRCPICAGADTRERFTLYDDRYGFPGQFPLFECGACGHAFLGNASFSDEQIGRLYSDYYPRRSMKVEDYRPHVERHGLAAWLDGARASAFRWVPRDVRVLDIGSGFGQALGYHTARGCEVWGVESDENALHVAERHGFNVRIGIFDPADYPAGHFDVVILDQVIEHMRDPVATMAGIRTVLKPGGVAILSTPNAGGWGARVFGRRSINWHAPYHLHFFSRRSMRIAAERAGLESRPLGTITQSEWLHYQWIHLATRPEPGRPSPFWSGKGGYTASQRIAMKAGSLLHRVRINHLITRAFDLVGVGDSQLFELRKA